MVGRTRSGTIYLKSARKMEPSAFPQKGMVPKQNQIKEKKEKKKRRKKKMNQNERRKWNDQRRRFLLDLARADADGREKGYLLEALKDFKVSTENQLLRALARLGVKHYNGAIIPDSYLPRWKRYRVLLRKNLFFASKDAESFSGKVRSHDGHSSATPQNVQTLRTTDSHNHSIQACPNAGPSKNSKAPRATVSSSDAACISFDDSGNEHNVGVVPRAEKFSSSNTCFHSFPRNGNLEKGKDSCHTVSDQTIRVKVSKEKKMNQRFDQKKNVETKLSSDVQVICKEEKNKDWKYTWYPEDGVTTKKENGEVVDVDGDPKDDAMLTQEDSDMLDANRNSDSDVRLVSGERQAYSATADGVWLCSVVNCCAVFSSKEKLTEHLKDSKHSPCNPKVGLLNGSLLSKPFSFMCSSCGEISESSLLCQKHIITAFHLPILPPLKIVAFACPYCLSFFSDRRNTLVHMARLNHHDVALRFTDDKPGKATPIAIPQQFAMELIKRCAAETTTVRCLDCNTDVSSLHQWSFHQQQYSETHTCVAYSPHTVANMVASLLCDRECSSCTQILFLSPGMEGEHRCSEHMTGTATGLKVSSFAEFVRRCSIGPPCLRSGSDSDTDQDV